MTPTERTTPSPCEHALLVALKMWRTEAELERVLSPRFGQEELDAAITFARRARWIERFRGHAGRWVYKRTGNGTALLHREARRRLLVGVAGLTPTYTKETVSTLHLGASALR